MRDLNLAALAILEGVHTELAGMGIPHISVHIWPGGHRLPIHWLGGSHIADFVHVQLPC